ncbi:MAG: glycosyltransferase family 39 protein, partial [Anaerolineales bacterium]
MEEPSVLDFVKSLIHNWREMPRMLKQLEPAEPSPPAEEPEASEVFNPAEVTKGEKPRLLHKHYPLASLLALVLALFAQLALEPPNPNPNLGIELFALAALALFAAFWRREIGLPPLPVEGEAGSDFRIFPPALLSALGFGGLAFLAFGGGDFNTLNLLLWLIATLSLIRAFYPLKFFDPQWFVQAAKWIKQPKWQVVIRRWNVIVVLSIAIILFFRFYHLNQVPPEMVSDHAEKLLDVSDVINGQWHIFFPRNTGREAFQMFLTAAVVRLFHTGLTFLSLKLGVAIAGLFTFPYIYLLGKEIGNQRVGLFAMLLSGTSYWLNVITHVALRFSLYPLFVAPTIYYLLKALRRPNPKDFILCGLFLGLGLHGYSPFRIVPFVILTAIALVLIHPSTAAKRKTILIGLIIIILVSGMVFLPLLRYAIQHPDQFNYRALTRLSDLEKPLDHPAWQIFLSNLWKAMIMFFWNNGGVWVVSIPGRPALGVIDAALLFLSMILVGIRYAQKRNWMDLFLLISIPMLMLPSILSLAFPDENPILNRTSGAIIPVFILIGLGLDELLSVCQRFFSNKSAKIIGWVVVLFLVSLAVYQDYDLIFHQYQDQYARAAWNTSEMGKIIHEFATTIGTPDSAWVVAYPYWVDTRLVGMNAGYPLKDYAIWPEQIPDTLASPSPKLFIGKPED